MAGDVITDPLYWSNRRKLREIIKNYSNPNQEPTLYVNEKVSEPHHTISREKILQREKDHRESNFKWAEFLQKYEPRLKDSFSRIRQKRRFIDLVYHGIPEPFRIKFWVCLLGINDLTSKDASDYENIKEGSKRYARLEDVFQIDKDVQRTFRDRAEFKKDFSQRQCMLFNVLMAYSFYNETLGYCQGMHQCAGLLLLYVPDEKSAFWGLHRLMTNPRYALHGMFLDCFPKYIRLRDDFERILRKKNKSLYNHLMECQTVTDTYLMLWYFTVFQADFPLSLSLRIWDIFLLEGDIIFLPMAYTLITYKEKELKKEECPKLYITNFKHTLQYEETSIIEVFKRNFRSMLHSSKHPLNAESPEGEVPKEFGTQLNRQDLKSNGFDDEEVAITEETKKKENEELIMRASMATGFERNANQRLSFVPYSPESTPPVRPGVQVSPTARNRIPLTELRNEEKSSFGSDSAIPNSPNIGENNVFSGRIGTSPVPASDCTDSKTVTDAPAEKEVVIKETEFNVTISEFANREQKTTESPDQEQKTILDSTSHSETSKLHTDSATKPKRVASDRRSSGAGDAASERRIKSGRLFSQNSPSATRGAIAQLPSLLNKDRRSPSASLKQGSRNSSQNSKYSERGRDELDGGLTSNDESLGGGSLTFDSSTRHSPLSPSSLHPESPISPSSIEGGTLPPSGRNQYNHMSKRNASSTGYLSNNSGVGVATNSNSPNSSAELVAGEASQQYISPPRRGFLYGTKNSARSARGPNRSSLSPIALPDTTSLSNRYSIRNPNFYAEGYYNSSMTGSVGSSGRYSTRRDPRNTNFQSPMNNIGRSFLYTQGVAEKLDVPRNRTMSNRNSWGSDINYKPATTQSERGRARVSMNRKSQDLPPNISRFSEAQHDRYLNVFQGGQKLETEFSVNNNGNTRKISSPSRLSAAFRTSFIEKRSSANAESTNGKIAENGSGDQKSKKSWKKQSSKSEKSSVDKSKPHQKSADEEVSAPMLGKTKRVTTQM